MKGVPGLTSQLIPEEQAVREWGRKGEMTQQKIHSEVRSKGHETLMLSPVHSRVWWSWPWKGRSGEWLAWERRGHQRKRLKGAGLHSEDSEWSTQGPLQGGDSTRSELHKDLKLLSLSASTSSLPSNECPLKLHGCHLPSSRKYHVLFNSVSQYPERCQAHRELTSHWTNGRMNETQADPWLGGRGWGKRVR